MRALEFLQDARGQFSSTRLVFILWSVVVLAVWTMTSIQSGEPQPISEWTAAVLFALMTGKVWQKYPESK